MRCNRMYLVRILALTYLVCFIDGENCNKIGIPDFFQPYSRLSSNVAIVPIGLQQCVKQCLFRKHCQGITYSLDKLKCDLGGDPLSISGIINTRSITASRAVLQPLEIGVFNSCLDHECPFGFRCIQLRGGGKVCQPDLPCGNPPALEGADSPKFDLNNDSMGLTVTYSCQPQHISSGDPKLTCEPDGQWSILMFKCKLCNPDNYLFNVILNFCYSLNLDVELNYEQAKTQCSNIGGKLAKLDIMEKILFTIQEASVVDKLFIDGGDGDVEGDWRFEDGSRVNTSLFEEVPLQPHTLKNCLGVRVSTGQYLANKCDSLRHFVCEQL